MNFFQRKTVTWSFLKINSVSDISEDTILKVFKAINARKTCGPNGVYGRVLKYCAKKKKLYAIFFSIFQASIDLCKIPLIWKTATISPGPKKFNPAALNDFRPVVQFLWQSDFLKRLLRLKF